MESLPESPPSLLARLGVRRTVIIAVLLLVAGSFAFAPVRMVAAEALKIFRVQKVQTISLTAGDLQAISDALEYGEGHVDLDELGEAWVEGADAAPRDVSLEQAQTLVDFEIRLPEGLSGTPRITFQEPSTSKFKFNVKQVNALLELFGADHLMPKSVDGKEFTVRMPAAITVEYDAPAQGATIPGGMSGITVAQARSPELIVPDGVDPLQLREVMINVPFLPDGVRRQLAAVDDWENTLLVPDFEGDGRDITIKGVPAAVMSTPPQGTLGGPDGEVVVPETAEGSGGMASATFVVWNDHGVIRMVGGDMGEEAATALAASMIP